MSGLDGRRRGYAAVVAAAALIALPVSAGPLSVCVRSVSSDVASISAVQMRDELVWALKDVLGTGPGQVDTSPSCRPAQLVIDVRVEQRAPETAGPRAERRCRFVFELERGVERDRVGFEQRRAVLSRLGAKNMAQVLLTRGAALVAKSPPLDAAALDGGVATADAGTPNPEAEGVMDKAVDALGLLASGTLGIYLAQPFTPRTPAAVAHEVMGVARVTSKPIRELEMVGELRARFDASLPYRNQLLPWELKMALHTGPLTWTVGRQIFTFGPIGSPADHFCPRDLSDLSRIEVKPVFAARVVGDFGPLRVEAVYSPTWSFDTLSFFADHERVTVNANAQRDPWDATTAFIDPVTAQPQRYEFEEPGFQPTNFAHNAATGVRAQLSSSVVTFGVGAHYGTMDFAQQSETVDGVYVNRIVPQRTRGAHADLGLHFFDWSLTLMAAVVFTDALFVDDWHDSLYEPSYASASIDLLRGGWKLGPVALDLWLNGQIDVQLPKVGGRIVPTLEPEPFHTVGAVDVWHRLFGRSVIGSLTMTLWDRFQVLGTVLWDFYRIGYAAFAGLGYKPTPQTSIVLQAEIFGGRRDQVLGRFQGTNNRISLAVQHTFGER